MTRCEVLGTRFAIGLASDVIIFGGKVRRSRVIKRARGWTILVSPHLSTDRRLPAVAEAMLAAIDSDQRQCTIAEIIASELAGWRVVRVEQATDADGAHVAINFDHDTREVQIDADITPDEAIAVALLAGLRAGKLGFAFDA